MCDNDKFIVDNSYNPKPTDTSDIEIPAEISDLIEKIAEDVHDTWAAGRVADGWTFGPKRDDNEKKHPCLIPYDELPDSEKEYDRNTAISTIKLILKNGYEISKIK